VVTPTRPAVGSLLDRVLHPWSVGGRGYSVDRKRVKTKGQHVRCT